MSTASLRLEAVTKRYAEKVAVDSVTFSVPEGSIYGLLGPNGAGKTSIIRMITSITAPDDGKIWFHGEPLHEDHNRQVGYLPEERGLYRKMKVGEHLIYLLRLRGLSKADAHTKCNEWMERLDISTWYNKEVGELSKGMQQKVQFIATVAHDPKLLILDEPFSGLDPINTQIIENEIHRLNKEGTTIIFSTHRMEQVEELCERIALISNGKLILEDHIDDARQKYQKGVYDIRFQGDAQLLESLPEAILESNIGSNAKLKLREGFTYKQLMQSLINSELEIHKFELHLPRLQEIFIEVVQNA